MAFSSFGSVVTLHNVGTFNTKCVSFDTNKLGCIWIRDSDENMCVGVVSFSGNAPTIETTQKPISAGDKWIGLSSRLSICNIDTNWIILVYRNPGDLYLYIQLYEVVANSFVLRDTKLTSETAAWAAICSIDTNKAILTYRPVSDSSGKVVAMTRSGSTLTLGSAVTTAGAGDDPRFPAIIKVDSNKFLLAYRKNSDTKGYCIAGSTPSGLDAAGRVITVGSEYKFWDDDIRDMSVCSPQTDKFCILFDNVTGTATTIIRGSVSTLTPNTGNYVNVSEDRPYIPLCVPVPGESDWVLCGFQDSGDSDKGKVNLVQIDWSGSSIYAFDKEIFSSNAIGGGETDNSLGMDFVDSNTVGIFYQDTTDSSYAKVVGGNISVFPDAPTNVVCTPGILTNQITWDSVIGATSYNIYWLNTPGVTKATGNKITGATSPYIHNGGLDPAKTYYYVVVAENAIGESQESSEVSGIPIAGAPENVAAVGALGKVTISWDVVGGASGYNIYYSTSPGVTKLNGTKIAGVTSPHVHLFFDDWDITYYYVVTAYDGWDESGESSEVYAIPLNPFVATILAGDSQNTISWDNVPSYLTPLKYNIYWSNTTGVTKDNGTKIADIESPYEHLELTIQDYYYVITFEYSGGESGESDELLGRPPFEGKIFDHVDIMLRKLLYQYRNIE